MSKRATLLLSVMLAASTLIMVESAFAQSTPKPSVPEFTLKYIDNSYDVPPTYEIDQYTGENVTTDYGQHVDNRTIEFTIKNQPFNPYEDAGGNNISLYYNFRFKGPYGNDWSYYPDTSHSYGLYTGLFPDTSASNSDYTVVTVNLRSLGIPIDSQVQFQVQAIIGYIHRSYTGMLEGDFYGFTGERSEWSNTQTITVGESQTPTPSPATTPTPTGTPTPPEEPQQLITFETIVGVAITAAVMFAGLGLLVYLIKKK